nr:hypothetical protein Iba_chr01dCG17620 [Ipomoea batatas]
MKSRNWEVWGNCTNESVTEEAKKLQSFLAECTQEPVSYEAFGSKNRKGNNRRECEGAKAQIFLPADSRARLNFFANGRSVEEVSSGLVGEMKSVFTIKGAALNES